MPELVGIGQVGQQGVPGGLQLLLSGDGQSWATQVVVQISTAAPSGCLFGDVLWLASIAQDGGNALQVASSADLDFSDTGQSSNLAPAMKVFNGELWIAYIGAATGNVEVISSANGQSWSGRVLTGQASSFAPTAMSLPAAGPPGGLGGFNQYVLWCGTDSGQPFVPITGLAVGIIFTEDLVVESGSPPIGFQINGFSQKGDSTICWQQYGIQMDPGTNQLNSFAENWPESLNTNPNAQNVFNLHSAESVSLPNDSTIPAGWEVWFTFQYQPDGLITGFNCIVQDSASNQIGSLNIDLLGQPLAAGGTIGQGDLAQLVAFQVVLVGWANKAGSTLIGGAGQINCLSDTPMQAQIPWPSDSDGNNGTAEEANSTYGLMPGWLSTSIVQSFGYKSAG
jgi:hypothetical protein